MKLFGNVNEYIKNTESISRPQIASVPGNEVSVLLEELSVVSPTAVSPPAMRRGTFYYVQSFSRSLITNSTLHCFLFCVCSDAEC